MIISICGSLKFYQEMRLAQKQLKLLGHKALVPKSLSLIEKKKFTKPKTVKERMAAEKKYDFIREHFKKIERSEAILVVNEDKKGVKGYIGGNTFLEMGIAFYLNKKIYLMKPIPKMEYELELQAMRPIVLGGDLTKLRV